MRTRVKPCGQGPVTGVYACEATLCAETSHAGNAKRQSQVATLSDMTCNVTLGLRPNQQSRVMKKRRKRRVVAFAARSLAIVGF